MQGGGLTEPCSPLPRPRCDRELREERATVLGMGGGRRGSGKKEGERGGVKVRERERVKEREGRE